MIPKNPYKIPIKSQEKSPNNKQIQGQHTTIQGPSTQTCGLQFVHAVEAVKASWSH